MDAIVFSAIPQGYILHLSHTVCHLISSRLIPLDKQSMTYRHPKCVNQIEIFKCIYHRHINLVPHFNTFLRRTFTSQISHTWYFLYSNDCPLKTRITQRIRKVCFYPVTYINRENGIALRYYVYVCERSS